MSQIFFVSKNLIVSLLGEDDSMYLFDNDDCHTWSCCAPPVSENPCELSVLAPGLFKERPLSHDDLIRLIQILKKELRVEETGVHLKLCPRGSREVHIAWQDVLHQELGAPVRVGWK